ncbi:hypothetical protein [Jeotgalibacillus campisalis]|uniref:Uncharacterized protein n=1 Tax=Jeotgalibacillus campisalis TaxID=220754 RepID=A0A0C2VF64_9BACL|nr:hypothetical protein [Jeotgalibacillus campisalis]KIL43171.1 hypothetical protein KR50_35740 [Jeotgalibacillus campisalis]
MTRGRSFFIAKESYKSFCGDFCRLAVTRFTWNVNRLVTAGWPANEKNLNALNRQPVALCVHKVTIITPGNNTHTSLIA